MASLPPVTKPPNELPEGNEGLRVLWDYVTRLYRDLVLTHKLTVRSDALGSVETLTVTLSDPPTKAQVQQVLDRLNEVITAARSTS